MEFSLYRFRLKFNDPLHLAKGSRTGTPAVFLKLKYNGYTGYGEAVVPPYRQASPAGVIDFLKRNLENKNSPEEALNSLSSPNACPEGRAALEMAVYDIFARKTHVPLYQYLNYPGTIDPLPAITLSPELPQDLPGLMSAFNATFKQFKLKLGLTYDRSVIKWFRNLTDSPFWADVNGGWKDAYYALDMIHYLKEKGALFVEQPMDDFKGLRWLLKRSPLPIVLDESFQDSQDLDKLEDLCHGINLKLMKCGGFQEAQKVITKAKEKGFKLLIGCMSGASCSVTAAGHLAGNADWIDLDGPFLIKNDPFEGIKVQDGKLLLPSGPGLGVEPGSYFPEEPDYRN